MKFVLVLSVLLVLVTYASLVSARCICYALYDPVCGENGVTYSNSCFMSCDNVKLAHKGPCSENNIS